ncbi:MAG: tRNA uridine-5-carboxymethylaminomethyl(34) synthesis GTPase MnmE [Candidatus Limimorpha sp.]|nr:tRNA uridine-5-carboxymethylaminomethyl(34) synthesis GTPase MnmE [Bacteroidales bacterium]MDY6075005.1 tRNA uridine-5-carboxymethylaminomethyl(34) synthesis GTPase MnmE [Bacteroidales bacterium]
MSINTNDAICAIATASGMGAIAVVRLSGQRCHEIALSIFKSRTRNLDKSSIVPNKAYFGDLVDGTDVVDEAIVTFFASPHSYTGEDSVEISCHGSVYIQQKVLEILIARGARLAGPGEFSRRAFLNNKLDLAQAEAVADLIASQSEASHKIAVNQLKGGFSKELRDIRSRLLDITSLLELELDFSEEDVEFADRTQLLELIEEAISHIGRLTESFRLGNAIKNGIPVTIAGETNTGKSTLLNAILGEERAIVSDIEGTTRDTVEETFNIFGTLYRFIDTAGIRQTTEEIERIGIERTFKKMEEADVILGMVDMTKGLEKAISAIRLIVSKVDRQQQTLIVLCNKRDVARDFPCERLLSEFEDIPIEFVSAKDNDDVERIKRFIFNNSSLHSVGANETLVTNMRHYESLRRSKENLEQVREGIMVGLSADLLSQDLRQALFYLGSITGEITNDEVLGNIFGRFCVGK